MDIVEPRKGRYFTAEAHALAKEAKRLKTENALPKGTLQVFVVRHSDHWFFWEIRRFGAIALDRSKTTYETMILARSAGEAALAKM